MRGYWLCDTQQGSFRIEMIRLAGRDSYVVFYENQPLGSSDTAEAALMRLIQGATHKPSCGLDIARMALPTVLSDWTFASAP
ncbi:hypothetical protein U8607_23105 [Methylobacterium durans]|uniref:Uncharacterized protein n=1 Tax=Methylobacterium durans TaxID=2202825 RepID=A0A2U8WAD2_9HYPH|nr:hypothetical protein [Methylobacterium durans]AWN42400.1 hypothetical protein DK389_20245 [Methylobacterium durans]MEA1834988.1 hypothetical protein [Methylobacterium durans]